MGAPSCWAWSVACPGVGPTPRLGEDGPSQVRRRGGRTTSPEGLEAKLVRAWGLLGVVHGTDH